MQSLMHSLFSHHFAPQTPKDLGMLLSGKHEVMSHRHFSPTQQVNGQITQWGEMWLNKEQVHCEVKRKL